jgi:hypothetical protein
VIDLGGVKEVKWNSGTEPEDNIDDVKGSFHKELECVFNNFPKCHMKILLGDFSAKVGMEDIFKPTIGNGALHKIGNENVATAVCRNLK